MITIAINAVFIAPLDFFLHVLKIDIRNFNHAARSPVSTGTQFKFEMKWNERKYYIYIYIYIYIY